VRTATVVNLRSQQMPVHGSDKALIRPIVERFWDRTFVQGHGGSSRDIESVLALWHVEKSREEPLSLGVGHSPEETLGRKHSRCERPHLETLELLPWLLMSRLTWCGVDREAGEFKQVGVLVAIATGKAVTFRHPRRTDVFLKDC
jgi:hypothetical protein